MAFDSNQFEQLQKEFSRLNNQFDALLKVLGVTAESIKKDIENLPSELEAPLKAVKAAAQRAGEERKAQGA
jgi:ElaB/YqjD/DUF883 family membrane-anchored ribosome-binding protein